MRNASCYSACAPRGAFVYRLEGGDYSHPRNRPANGREPTIRLIHLTDPHLTSLDGLSLLTLRGKRWSGYLSWRRRRRFVHRREVLERLTDAVRCEAADQVLLTGDLVHVGLPGEIETAAEWLRTLGPPERVMLVPGNHDVYAGDSWPAMVQAWGPYLRSCQEGATREVEFPQLRLLQSDDATVSLIGLSSAVPSPLFMAYGRLGGTQRHRLEALLAHAQGFRCVLVHHPPFPAMTRWRKGLTDAVELERLVEHRGVHLVLHGHVHRNVACSGPGASRVYGTASASSEGSDRAAYRRFDISRRGAGWHVEMRLVTVDEEGAAVVGSEAWEAPLTPTANVASAARGWRHGWRAPSR